KSPSKHPPTAQQPKSPEQRSPKYGRYIVEKDGHFACRDCKMDIFKTEPRDWLDHLRVCEKHKERLRAEAAIAAAAIRAAKAATAAETAEATVRVAQSSSTTRTRSAARAAGSSRGLIPQAIAPAAPLPTVFVDLATSEEDENEEDENVDEPHQMHHLIPEDGRARRRMAKPPEKNPPAKPVWHKSGNKVEKRMEKEEDATARAAGAGSSIITIESPTININFHQLQGGGIINVYNLGSGWNSPNSSKPCTTPEQERAPQRSTVVANPVKNQESTESTQKRKQQQGAAKMKYEKKQRNDAPGQLCATDHNVTGDKQLTILKVRSRKPVEDSKQLIDTIVMLSTQAEMTLHENLDTKMSIHILPGTNKLFIIYDSTEVAMQLLMELYKPENWKYVEVATKTDKHPPSESVQVFPTNEQHD
ncbi:hypothetical protein B566_EDAN016334, partial [Ephemera danica]